MQVHETAISPRQAPTGAFGQSKQAATARACSSELESRDLPALVRIDQIFFAGRALAVDGDVRELQRLLQRDYLRVMAGKGRLEFGHHPLAQFGALGRSDL